MAPSSGAHRSAKPGSPSLGEALLELMGEAAARRRRAAREPPRRPDEPPAGARRGVRALARTLEADDPEVVTYAAGLLGKSWDPCAVPLVARLLGHGHARVVQMALHSLAVLDRGLPRAALADLLERAPWLRTAAVHALDGPAGEPTFAALAPLVHEASRFEHCVAAVRRMKPRDAVPLLLELLREAPDARGFAEVLSATGEALERQPQPQILHHLETWVRVAAAEAEAPDGGRHLARALSGDDPPLLEGRGPRPAVAAMVRAFARAPLYATLVLAGQDPALQGALPSLVPGLGPDVAPSLHAGLGSQNGAVRLLACQCVAALGLLESAPWVEELLQDDDERVRAAAVHTLAGLRHDASVPGIVALLRDPAPRVRDAALVTLGEMDPEIVTVTLLCDVVGTGSLRQPALGIMRANPHPEQRRYIEACLGDRRPRVRGAALAALTSQGGTGLVEAVTPLLRDPCPEVRAEAVAALGRSGDGRARDLLVAQIERDVETREEAVLALAELADTAAIPELLRLVQPASPEARAAIARILGAPASPADEAGGEAVEDAEH